MCKYCKLEKGVEGEFHGIESLLKMTDGRQVFEVFLNRYIYNGRHDSSLVLDYAIKVSNDVANSIRTKQIKIKYCPFCGEEL